MRRLIIALISLFIGTRVRTNAQHIADLERMLSDLVTARDTIDAEIEETTRRLIAAQAGRDRLNAMRGQWIREVGVQRGVPYIPQPTPERRAL